MPLRPDLVRSNFLDSQVPMLKGSLGSACRGVCSRSWCFSLAASSSARAASLIACVTCSHKIVTDKLVYLLCGHNTTLLA